MLIRNRLRGRTAVPDSRLLSAGESESGCLQSSRIWSRLPALLYASEEGQAALETILVITFIFLPLLLGIFSVTMALVSYQKLGYATFIATQTVGAGRSLLTDPCATVAATVTGGLPKWTAGSFTYTVWITSTNPSNVTTVNKYGPYTGTAGSTCTAAAATLVQAQGNAVTVEVAYAYNWFPIFGKKIAGTLIAEQTVLAS